MWAEKIIGGELKRKGWTEDDLRVRRKGDVFKVRLAQRLRVETTVTLKWIAERLRMGTRGSLWNDASADFSPGGRV